MNKKNRAKVQLSAENHYLCFPEIIGLFSRCREVLFLLRDRLEAIKMIEQNEST